MSDDTQAVVVEVSEAVGAALNEFQLSAEALGDAVVFIEAPHRNERLLPVLKAFAQAREGCANTLEWSLDEDQHDAEQREAPVA